jgi:hypothetical protein
LLLVLSDTLCEEERSRNHPLSALAGLKFVKSILFLK